ncbi:chromosome partitioning protein [Streptomonospora nanhaiensis]|uniref:Chromosome partitioning protein n=1 Tax=Streptomonospora nanhaiensis TaxID=1323731 RepID=A0A853BXW0_9ACTN|nr:ParA family protein [Streptomonospora nanhaiensis]NYI99287.1 chromosome partitioning protein [Streptomonospora nanhaiensis]
MSDDPKIYAVASWKGGVGKTTLAYELAYQLGAVLVDLDWDKGSSTRAWGYRTELRLRSPLLAALESGGTKIPRYVSGEKKPDLLPGHEDFAMAQPEAEAMADLLESWAKAWGRDLVVDCHPGGSTPSTLGAMAAAQKVVVPAPLAEKPMEALQGMLEQVPDYPLLVVPYQISGVPPARYRRWLRRITTEAGVPVGPPVGEYSWIEGRTLRRAISSEPVPKRAEQFVGQVAAVAAEVVR